MKNFVFIAMLIAGNLCCKKSDEKLLKVGNFPFEVVTDLPNIINESSGLEVASPNSFWSFNDHNGEPELYEFDTLGNRLRTVRISNGANIDWEDIAKDEQENMYVGDFGNNDNDRQDLTIYKISKEDLGSNNNEVTASKIEYHYSEQSAFPPPKDEFIFDVEAMFSKDNFLYLLTRDRSNPFIGKTNLYRLPNIAGNFETELIQDFVTDTNKSKGQITAADLSPNGNNMVMISNETMWLFQNIIGENFFGGEMLKLELPIQLDMEGVIFYDDCNIYMSNEDKSSNPAILYKVNICI